MKVESLRRKVARLLRETLYGDPEDSVHVCKGELPQNIHVLIVSPKFEGALRQSQEDAIWSLLFEKLTPQEWGHITLTRGISPHEMNGMSLRDIKLYT